MTWQPVKSIIDTALERLRLRKEQRERDNVDREGKKMRKRGETNVGGDEKKVDEEDKNDAHDVEKKANNDVNMTDKQDKYTSPMEGKK